MAASTVWDAFNQFAAKITPTDNQKSTMSGRREKAHEVLEDAFAGSNMPLLKTKLIGSAGRNTIIRPIDDVDVFAVFDDSEVWKDYEHDSRKLLHRVRDALNDKYKVNVGSRGQAVRLFFTESPDVEIVPAFAVDGRGYCIPHGVQHPLFGNPWQMTDPYVHETFLSQRNTDLGGNLKRLTRFLKRWNAIHGRRFSSFHLELLAQAPFKSLGTNSRENCSRFFRWAPDYLDVEDPAGWSGSMMKNVDVIQRSLMSQALQTAFERADKALGAESDGDHEEAIRLWRITFGDEFPAYG